MISEKPLTEKESLQLITEMIQKAKTGQFHESGLSPILWGSVVGFAGIMTFIKYYYSWDIGFDWWLLPLFAIIPQLILAYQENKHKRVKTHEERALDTVWLIFGISIFCLIAYSMVVPGVTAQMLSERGIEVLQKNVDTAELKPFTLFPPSIASLMIMIYAFPTMVTGIVQRFKPMIIGALLCYFFFAISLYTSSTWDNLLSALAGIFNWLIPGIILRRHYLKSRRAMDV